METQTQSLTGKLNHLIAIAEDGKNGYESAGKDVKDETLKSLFLRFSAERDGYLTQLQNHVRDLDADTGKAGPAGTLHRAWIDIKAVLTSGNKNAIINACITGEDYAIMEYDKVIELIKSDSPLKQMLVSQRSGIQAALSSIKAHLDK